MKVHNYPIGFQYQTRDKHPRVCTITEQYTVVNSKGYITKIYYESVSEFAGQTVTDYDVCETTVSFGACKLQDVDSPSKLIIEVSK